MPLAIAKISKELDSGMKEEILKAISKLLSDIIGKPETYIMVEMEDNSDICMSGNTSQPSAFISIKSIGGLTGDVNRQLSESICGLLTEKLSIESSRVYITFENVEAKNWGWNSSTFG